MKKVIGIILSAAAALSCTSALAFSDLPTTADTELMEKLGIISGYSDGTFKPDETITRAEAVKMVVALYGISDEDVEGLAKNVGFSDVDEDYWAYSYIVYAQTIGIINGFEDGTFRPDENVTEDQAIKMLVETVGYGVYAQSSGGYPSGYRTWGDAVGIIDNSQDIDYAGDATRGEVLEMAEKTLYAPLCLISSYDIDIFGNYSPVFVLKDGTGSDYKNLLINYFDVYTTIAEVTSVDGNKANIDIVSAINFDDEYVNPKENDKLSVTVDLDDGVSVEKGKQYTMYIRINDLEEQNYDLLLAYECE
ncbi:MAG: S-layer homology domain-containing protein [Oscillospiraceae bacterium]|nr:S-layer homology domain-containing protein [Oscillospiraceae bacterium]